MLAADARTGTTVGKYRLHEIVGRGGMGVVYRGEHVYIGKEVAVKILHEGYGGREEAIKRFLREARAASLINHPNIVDVTDFGKGQDGTVFFVMELLIGEPLDAVLGRERRLSLLRAITICNQMAAALAAAHGKGIIHRDLKPENVMLMPREGRRELIRKIKDESGLHEISERETQFDFVKILDFGVAKVREPDAKDARKVTQQGVVFGTPEYMAPETARVGFSDARSDVYALGVMFYEMLTGVVPFTAEAPVEVMLKQVNEAVVPPRKLAPDAEITEEAEVMILKALAKDPDRRHQTMEDFHRDLQRCYGSVRFRRALRTPTVSMEVPIPLTKKKPPGAVSPAPVVTSGAAARAAASMPAVGANGRGTSLAAAAAAQRPAAAAAASSAAATVTPGVPILLTKRKSRRIPVDPTSFQQTPPPLFGERPAAKAGATAANATPPPVPLKKRKTLPLGMSSDETPSGADPAAAAADASSGALPAQPSVAGSSGARWLDQTPATTPAPTPAPMAELESGLKSGGGSG
jgi:serine/threonine protein kinase